MVKNITAYYYCIGVGIEVVVHGSQIKVMDKGYIEANECYQVSTDIGKLGQRMMKLGVHSNIAINCSFIAELSTEAELLKVVKEFEMRREANVIVEGNG